MLIYNSEDYIYIFLLIVALFLLSFIAPLYGFSYKGWRGLGLGCMVQPLFACLLCLAGGFVVYLHQEHALSRYHNAALVVVRTTSIEKEDTLQHFWYLKPDEECLCESLPIDDDPDDADDYNLFDVIRLDSFSLCVEDRIVVRFHPDSRTVTATDLDEPIEIVRVDSAKVEEFFLGGPGK